MDEFRNQLIGMMPQQQDPQTQFANQLQPQHNLFLGQQATGFQEAPNKFVNRSDKKERFEINDKESHIKSTEKELLGDVLHHPTLFKNYPDLKKISVLFAPLSEWTKGGTTKDNKIVLNQSLMKDKEEVRKALLHEIQHIIQDKEGFSQGSIVGNPLREQNLSSYLNNPGEQEARRVTANLLQ